MKSIIMRTIALIVFCLCCRLAVFAEGVGSYRFRHIDVEDGLSQCMVYAIHQDREGFLWFGTQNGLNRYDGVSLKTFKHSGGNAQGLENNSIFSLEEDNAGNLWVGTETGVTVYNPVSETFSPIELQTADKKRASGIVRTMKRDSKGNMWVGVSGAGLFRIDSHGKQTFLPLGGLLTERGQISSMCLDASGNLYFIASASRVVCVEPDLSVSLLADNKNEDYAAELNCLKFANDTALLVGTAGKSVFAINPGTKRKVQLSQRLGLPAESFVRWMELDKKGNLWVGTQDGLYITGMNAESPVHLKHSYFEPYSLSDNAVHSLCLDRNGGMWVGTYFGGVNYFSGNDSGFEKFFPSPAPDALWGKCISEFCEDLEGRMWIGTEDAGLHLLTTDGKFLHPLPEAKNVHALLNDGARIWVGTFADGLFTIDQGSLQPTRILHQNGSKGDQNIYAIFKDAKSRVWVGTRTGMQTYDPASNRLSDYPIGISSQVNDIVEDSAGRLWIASVGQGVFVLEPKDGSWKRFSSVSRKNVSAGAKATCIMQGSGNTFWVGTKGGGLSQLDAKGKIIKEYTTGEGLPDDVVYKLISAPDGAVWGSTDCGLFRIDPHNGTVRTYTHSDGLPGNQFNYKSGFADSRGNIYFGGVKGFVRFRHDRLIDGNGSPTLTFTSLRVSQEEVSPATHPEILSASITQSPDITLSSDRKAFAISFQALNYASPHRIDCDYKLEGWDRDWRPAPESRQVQYSFLPPGNYRFRVRMADIYGKWKPVEKTLSIRVLPPFYLSAVAICLYAVLAVTIMFVVLSHLRRKIRKREREARSRLQHEYEKELYKLKINYFTDITHEIRTPLSLIKIPVDELISKTPVSDPGFSSLSMVKRNTDRLLTLVNQLLDFRRAESADLKLNFTDSNITDLTERTADEFRPSLLLKGLEFNLRLPEKLYAHVDEESYRKILANLLGNALKHAGSMVSVSVVEKEDVFELRVSNDGDLIPADKVETIFEPFVKVDEASSGTGIGLSLVRKLMEGHGGTISVDQSDGTVTFAALFPLRQRYAVGRGKGEEVEVKASANDEREELEKQETPVVLLVEDDADMLSLMQRQLSESFRVVAARNGKEALAALDSRYVDIMVSDVMMPLMNGMELCAAVKSTPAYAHIPVILLTANPDDQARLKGLEAGAEEYIVKPYSIGYLKARILNLIATRRRLAEMFRNEPEAALETIADNESHKTFLNALIRVIEESLSDPELDVEFLAERMNVSRATLYRKIKGVSEQTPNDFIRIIRLKKAAEMLRNADVRINEVADLCGFSSASYFTKSFYKQFGTTPKEFQTAGAC